MSKIAFLCALLLCPFFLSAEGVTRTYYIAADEVEWNYCPLGLDGMTGKPFESTALAFTKKGPDRIGTIYRKAIYQEYTDDSFSKLKARPSDAQYLGLVGPVLHAEVGDTIKILFKNNATHPYSVHPHGVFYLKDSEGASYEDGTSGADKKDDAVPPGETHLYTWLVPERAGPGPSDPSSIVWLYHSHSNEPKDVNSGLIGAMIITRRGFARPDGAPKDVDREIFALFMVFDENQSWYIDYNIQKYAGDPKSVNKMELIPQHTDGGAYLLGMGFADVNHKFSINGYLYGNMPMMKMKKGERVRWYMGTLGDFFNFHTPHWHGNTLLSEGKRVDVVGVNSAQTIVADMIPDNPGMWMFHCHISDHLEAGMHVHYEVDP